jgi:hypothetical protein
VSPILLVLFTLSSPRLVLSLRRIDRHTRHSLPALEPQAQAPSRSRMERQRSLIREARFAASRPRRLSEVGQTPSSAPDRDLVASQETEFIGSVTASLPLHVVDTHPRAGGISRADALRQRRSAPRPTTPVLKKSCLLRATRRAIDCGTTSCRFYIFDQWADVVAHHQIEFEQRQSPRTPPSFLWSRLVRARSLAR